MRSITIECPGYNRREWCKGKRRVEDRWRIIKTVEVRRAVLASKRGGRIVVAGVIQTIEVDDTSRGWRGEILHKM